MVGVSERSGTPTFVVKGVSEVTSNVSHGMNVEEVEALGRLLQAKGDQLRHIAAEISSGVYSLQWDGSDAVAFIEHRWPSHRVQLMTTAEAIHGFGQSALNNANEQRGASTAGSGGGPHGSVGTSPGGGGGSWGTSTDWDPTFDHIGSVFGGVDALELGSLAIGTKIEGATKVLGPIGYAFAAGTIVYSWNAHGIGDARTWEAIATPAGGLLAGGAVVVAGGTFAAGSAAFGTGALIGTGISHIPIGDHRNVGDAISDNFYDAMMYSDPGRSAAEVSARTQNPLLLGYDIGRGTVKAAGDTVMGWFH